MFYWNGWFSGPKCVLEIIDNIVFPPLCIHYQKTVLATATNESQILPNFCYLFPHPLEIIDRTIGGYCFLPFPPQITIRKTVADSCVKCTQTAIATINDCLFRHPLGNVRPHQIRYLFSPFLPQIHRFLYLSLIRVVHFVLQFHCLWLSEDEKGSYNVVSLVSMSFFCINLI